MALEYAAKELYFDARSYYLTNTHCLKTTNIYCKIEIGVSRCHDRCSYYLHLNSLARGLLTKREFKKFYILRSDGRRIRITSNKYNRRVIAKQSRRQLSECTRRSSGQNRHAYHYDNSVCKVLCGRTIYNRLKHCI